MLEGSEDRDLRLAYGRALEAYMALILQERVVGAYEFDADLSVIEPVRPLVWGSVAAAGVIVFASLLIVLVNTSAARPRPISPTAASGPTRCPPPPLTRRELAVLRLMADGLTYGQIAETLGLDEETVRSHAKGVLRKLGQPNRTAAVLAARRGALRPTGTPAGSSASGAAPGAAGLGRHPPAHRLGPAPGCLTAIFSGVSECAGKLALNGE